MLYEHFKIVAGVSVNVINVDVLDIEALFYLHGYNSV